MASITIQPSDNEPLLRATYGAGNTGFTPAATPTLVWLMQGVAGKIIRIKSLTFSASAGTPGLMGAALKRYTTAAAAGTFVTATNMRHDLADVQSNAVVGHYTVNPTPGTSTGTIHAGRLGFSGAGQIDRLSWQFGWLNDKAIVLQNATDWVGLDLLGGAVPAGGVIDWDIWWTEESDARALTPAI